MEAHLYIFSAPKISQPDYMLQTEPISSTVCTISNWQWYQCVIMCPRRYTSCMCVCAYISCRIRILHLSEMPVITVKKT